MNEAASNRRYSSNSPRPIKHAKPRKFSVLPCIHRSLTSKAQSCDECTKQGENLKPISPKQELGNLTKLSQPNDELQMDFARQSQSVIIQIAIVS